MTSQPTTTPDPYITEFRIEIEHLDRLIAHHNRAITAALDTIERSTLAIARHRETRDGHAEHVAAVLAAES